MSDIRLSSRFLIASTVSNGSRWLSFGFALNSAGVLALQPELSSQAPWRFAAVAAALLVSGISDIYVRRLLYTPPEP